MSDAVEGVIVSHGVLARALIEAVDCIVGAEHGLTAVSNEGCGNQHLEERISAVLGDNSTILFTDMPGGSCFMAAAKLQRNRENLRVITGVNLSMLLDFVHGRDGDIDTVVNRLIDSGKKSIRLFPS